MSDAAVFVAMSIVVIAVLVILAVILWRRPDRRGQPLTLLSGLAATCVVCGIVFGEDRVVGYSFFAAGISLAIVDAVRRSRSSGSSQPTARR